MDGKLIEIIIIFGFGLIGFFIALIEEIFLDWKEIDMTNGDILFGHLVFFLACLIPVFGWPITIALIVRYIDKMFKFKCLDEWTGRKKSNNF